MNEILAKQLAIDFCTDVNSILSKENVFTEYKQLEGRRIFKEGECYFKAASVNGKIVASGRKDIIQWARETSVYKGYKQDKIEMRGDRAEMSDFPLYLNTVAGGLDRRDQTIGGFSFVVKIYAVPVVEIIG